MHLIDLPAVSWHRFQSTKFVPSGVALREVLLRLKTIYRTPAGACHFLPFRTEDTAYATMDFERHNLARIIPRHENLFWVYRGGRPLSCDGGQENCRHP